MKSASASALAGAPISFSKYAFSRAVAAAISGTDRFDHRLLDRHQARNRPGGKDFGVPDGRRAISSSGSQTRQTRPIRSASSASTHSEDISSQAAFCRPINCGSRYDEAASGATPRLVKGHFSRAVDDMNARSA